MVRELVSLIVFVVVGVLAYYGRRKHPYVMERPISSDEQMREEGEAWGQFYAGLGQKPNNKV